MNGYIYYICAVAEIMTKNDKPCGSIEIYDQEALKEYICFSGTERKTMLAFDRLT